MLRHCLLSRTASAVVPLLMIGLLHLPAAAGPPTKKRVKPGHATPKKARVIPREGSRVRKARPTKSYVRTRRDYGHVRVARYPRRDDGTLNVRPIFVRSARTRPVVLHRFEDRRREQIRLTVRYFREGHRARALEIWGAFIDGLADYGEPVDLDEVMLYVAREGCLYKDDMFLFHAAKVEFLRESVESVEDYIDQLYDQRDACVRGERACSSTTLNNLETELIRMRAELETMEIQARVAGDALGRIMESSKDHEHRFAAVFDDMYREVELRIRFSP